VRKDLGKRDILRFGVVGLSRTLLSGSLESLRVACMKNCCCCAKEVGGFRGEKPYLNIGWRVSIECWNLPEIGKSEGSGVIQGQRAQIDWAVTSIASKKEGLRSADPLANENYPQPTRTFYGIKGTDCGGISAPNGLIDDRIWLFYTMWLDA
jgi:hypothetical protein